MDYMKISELVDAAQQQHCTIGEVVLCDQAEEMGISKEEAYNRMEERLQVMEESIGRGLQTERSVSGLTGGDGSRMMQHVSHGMMGVFMDTVISRAIAVAEYNAAMGKIVAAPTAGSCGIMPACLISIMEEKQIPRKNIVLGMFTAAAIGMVITNKASVSGAAGGCQAECGSAAAMSAAALVEITGGTPDMAANACAISLKNSLGLVCDPVAGLVEIPCIKRNAQGAVNAFMAADMAMAGIQSKIPVDEVIEAMKEVGDALPCSLRETAIGGLAATPTGIQLKENLFGKR